MLSTLGLKPFTVHRDLRGRGHTNTSAQGTGVFNFNHGRVGGHDRPTTPHAFGSQSNALGMVKKMKDAANAVLSSNAEIAENAPRNLKLPVCCKHSALTKTRRPAMSSKRGTTTGRHPFVTAKRLLRPNFIDHHDVISAIHACRWRPPRVRPKMECARDLMHGSGS